MSKFDQTMRDKVMALAGAGAIESEIAKACGISPGTLTLWKTKNGLTSHGDDYTGFKQSLDYAKSIADDMVVCALLDNAVNKGNVVAQIFWLKNRRPREWRDKIEHYIEPIEEMEFRDEAEPQDTKTVEGQDKDIGKENGEENGEENNPF